MWGKTKEKNKYNRLGKDIMFFYIQGIMLPCFSRNFKIENNPHHITVTTCFEHSHKHFLSARVSIYEQETLISYILFHNTGPPFKSNMAYFGQKYVSFKETFAHSPTTFVLHYLCFKTWTNWNWQLLIQQKVLWKRK